MAYAASDQARSAHRRRPSMSRIKLYGLLTMCVVFTIVGAGMIVKGAEGAWLAFLFFGLCTAVFINGLWPGLLLRRAPPPETLLQRFPEPIELSVNRTKFLYVTIGAAIFGGLCVWELLDRQPGWFMTIVLWLCAIGCAAAIPVAIAAMFRGSSLAGWRKSAGQTSDFQLSRAMGGHQRIRGFVVPATDDGCFR